MRALLRRLLRHRRHATVTRTAGPANRERLGVTATATVTVTRRRGRDHDQADPRHTANGDDW